jgi:tetratricopeptide (TPR) repeat protein
MNLAKLHARVSSTGGLSLPMKFTDVNLFPSETEMNGYVQKTLGEFDKAEPLLNRALAIREKAFGAADARTIEVLEYLAPAFVLRRAYARAVPFYQRILAAREKTLGPEYPDVKAPLVFLAGCAMNEKKYREAIPYLKRLVAIQASENAKKPREHGGFASLRIPTIEDDKKEDDPENFAAQLRKAERLAAVEYDAASRTNNKDLEYFKREATASGIADVSALMAITELELDGALVNVTTLSHLRGLVNLKSLSLHQPIKLQHVRMSSEERRTVILKSASLNQALGDKPPPNINEGLSHLRRLTGLKTLDFFGTVIRGSGLSALAAMTELESLNLNMTDVGDDEIAALPVLPALRHLDLGITRVSDASLTHLAKFPRLGELRLNYTKVSAKGIEDLKRARPNLEVMSNLTEPR